MATSYIGSADAAVAKLGALADKDKVNAADINAAGIAAGEVLAADGNGNVHWATPQTADTGSFAISQDGNSIVFTVPTGETVTFKIQQGTFSRLMQSVQNVFGGRK